MATLSAELFRRKPVVEMEAESGSETEESELSRSIGLFQLAMSSRCSPDSSRSISWPR